MTTLELPREEAGCIVGGGGGGEGEGTEPRVKGNRWLGKIGAHRGGNYYGRGRVPGA